MRWQRRRKKWKLKKKTKMSATDLILIIMVFSVFFFPFLFLKSLKKFSLIIFLIGMKEIFLVSSENKAKAEEAVKKDDLVSRSSIVVRSADSLEIKEDGYFIIIDGKDEAIKKAEELLKDLAKKYKKKEIVEKKMQEQEDSAIVGFGNILGG